MLKGATIPDFIDGDLRSMGTSLRAMKQQIETLSGQRQGQSQGAPAVYVQGTSPSLARNDVYKLGDFWINSDTKKLSYFNGKYWEAL